jgi:hypothetical protein
LGGLAIPDTYASEYCYFFIAHAEFTYRRKQGLGTHPRL